MSMFRYKPAGMRAKDVQRHHLDGQIWVAVMLVFALYFIAGSIGSGWMFLLCASVLSGVIGSIIYPYFSLRLLDIKQRHGETATAGDPFQISVTLSSDQRPLLKHLPSGLLLLRHEFQQCRTDGMYAARGTANESRLYETLVPAVGNRPVTVHLSEKGLPRGEHVCSLFVNTSFPFGLVWQERCVQSPQAIVVYPRIYSMEGFFLYRVRAVGTGAFGFPKKESSSSQSIFTRGVRDYVRGDSPRSVHWASTARVGKLMVREYDAEGLPYFDISFDLTAPWQSEEQFELAVSTVASLVALGQRMGLNPEIKLNPPLSELGLKLPAVLPGYEMNMEILARVAPVKNSARSPRRAEISSAETLEGGRAKERTTVAVCPAGQVPSEPDAYVIAIADATPGLAGGTVAAAVPGTVQGSVICDVNDICQL